MGGVFSGPLRGGPFPCGLFGPGLFPLLYICALACGDSCLLGTPFSRPPRLGCPLRWWGLGRRRASVATPCTRAPTLAAPRVLLPLFRTRAPLLRAQVWLFGCPFLRSPKHPLAGWLARLRAPSIPVVVGDFSGPLRGGSCPCGLLAPAFSRSCTSRPRPRFFPEASFPSSLAWYPV